MKKNTTAKRITAVLLALVLSFSLTATALATETPAVPVGESTQQVNQETAVPTSGEETGISPHDVDVLFGPKEILLGGIVKIPVTPTKGRNLKITIANVDKVTVIVTKSLTSPPIKTFDVPGDYVTDTFDLVNNCDGGQYYVLLKPSAIGMTVMVGLTQTQYI